jgi:hypothetical protein
MLQVTSLKVRSFNLDHLDVFWEISTVRGPLSDSTPHEIFDYTFTVLRSEAAMGPYDVVSNPLRDMYLFRDTRVSLLHKFRQYFYKILVENKKTGERAEFGPAASADPEPDLLAAEIIRCEEVLFREAIGRRCFLYPTRTFGPRCSCFDEALQRLTRSNHLPCFGTGWLGGYLSPVEMWIQIDPSTNAPVVGQLQEQHPNNTSARTTSFPPIKSRDIIIESENKRWRVVSMTPTERLRATVRQELQLHEIPRGDVEYSLPVNVDVTTLVASPERNFKNSQNVDDEDFSDIFGYYSGRPPRGALR